MKGMAKLLAMLKAYSYSELINLIGNFDEITDGYAFRWKQDSPVLLLAHGDTVCNRPVAPYVYQNGRYITNKLCSPLGGDDRVGCFIADTLSNKYDISMLITNHEESGGLGMMEFCESLSLPLLDGVKLIMQFDRRGTGEYVTYIPLPATYTDYIRQFGISKVHGSFSDSKILTNQTLIPHINMASGFYNEHTSDEYINTQDVNKCYNTACSIINNIHYLDYAEVILEPKKPDTHKYNLYDEMQASAWERFYGIPDTQKTVRGRIK